MRAAVLHGYDEDLRVESIPPPEIRSPADVIVRIGGAGLCRTDLHIIEGVWKEKVDVELPYILGHENAGWVEDVGPGVRSVKPGDAVIVHPVITCGLCQACRAGEDMHCIDLAFPGITQNGGFAEYLARRRDLAMGDAPGALAFTDSQGDPLAADGLADYVRLARSVRISLESNTEFCTGLLAARYDDGLEAWRTKEVAA
jgi:threonine dehydrogenase-like Zn-dependent dehydrogenase